MKLTLAFSDLLSFYAEWRPSGWWLGFTALQHNGLYISVALRIFALTLTFHFLCGFGWYTAHITQWVAETPRRLHVEEGGLIWGGTTVGGGVLFMQRQIGAVYRVAFLFQGA
jgi:hypothetical protein